MSLATRCTSCGTVFRVVQDQLKVSEGWVRCGRCDAVFNALEGLFDLERDAPPEWTAPAPPAVSATADAKNDATTVSALEHDPSLVDRIDEQIFGQRRSAFGALGGLARSERAEPEFADARFDSDAPDDAAAQPLLIDSTESSPPAIGADGSAPEFVRAAERQTRWQGSAARKRFAGAAVLLLATLTGQAVHHFRDELAARWPMTRAALEQWCAALGCSVEAPRHIEELVVESTALSRGSGADTFKLAVVLRNRAATPVATPWLELSLTDANGELVARRALSPAELNAAGPAIGRGAESGLSAFLSTGTTRITGYTVEVFYP